VTYLLPDTYSGEVALYPETAGVHAYGEGGSETWTGKVRSVLSLGRGVYPVGICPFDPSDAHRYYGLLLLLSFLRVRRRMLLAPRGGTRDMGRAAILVLILRCGAGEVREACAPRVHRLVDRFMKCVRSFQERVGDRFDAPAWFFLVFLARVRRAVRRCARSSARTRPQGREGYEAGSSPKVAHFISSLEMGGVQRQFYTFLAGTRSRLPCDTVFVFQPVGNRFEKGFLDMGISIVRVLKRVEDSDLTGTERFFWRHFPLTLSTLRLRSLLKGLEGVTLVHNWEFTANVIGSVAAGLAGVPGVVSSVRNMRLWKETWHGKGWGRTADRWTAGLNDCIVVNAEAVKEDYRSWARVPGSRMRVIHNGLDPESLPEPDPGEVARIREGLGWKAETTVIGWAGRLVPQKDPELFLEVAGVLAGKYPETRFLVLGDGPLMPRLLALREQRGLDDVVRFHGARLDARRWMNAFDLLLLTSLFEGMPNVLIEAQMMGIPCVTTDAGGAAEVVLNGRTGVVAPVKDAGALVEGCCRILEDPRLRERFVEAGRQRARERFHAGRMLEETLRMYDDLSRDVRSA